MYFRHHKNIWEYTGDTFGQPVITEENLFLYRVRRFYDCCLECIFDSESMDIIARKAMHTVI